MVDAKIKSLVLSLFEIEAIKFGDFTLKSGIKSPIYLDLRVIVSFPKILAAVAEQMYAIVTKAGVEFDIICGVPYTALPIATVMSIKNDIGMVMKRKEVGALSASCLSFCPVFEPPFPGPFVLLLFVVVVKSIYHSLAG